MRLVKIVVLIAGCAAAAVELLSNAGGNVVNVTGLLTVAGVIAV